MLYILEASVQLICLLNFHFLLLQEVYETVGIVCHRGSIKTGHWFALVRLNWSWILINDACVPNVRRS